MYVHTLNLPAAKQALRMHPRYFFQGFLHSYDSHRGMIPLQQSSTVT